MSEEQKLEVTVYKEEKLLEKDVDAQAVELSKKIAKSSNKDELESLYDAFKINDTKKNAFRMNKLNELLDKIVDEAGKRLEHRSDEMTNKEIIDYMNALQAQIDHSKSTIEGIKEVNAVQVNKVSNTMNINIGDSATTLSRESREKIMDVVRDILTSAQSSDTIDVSVDDKEDKSGGDKAGTD